jgi:malate dehydrogenase
LADVALVDVVEGLAEGKALDLAQAAPIEGHDGAIVGGTTYDVIRGAKVVVVTAGLARKPGMSRSDLLEANAKILQSIIPQVAANSPQAILIIVTNPLDAMTYCAWQLSRFPVERVMGMAGVLDSARLRTFAARALKVHPKEIEALVLGGHGDTMVPLPAYTTVKGKPIAQLLPESQVREIFERTKSGGAEVVKLLKTGSAFYAPASAVTDMIRAILQNEKRLLPVCAYLKGQYGLSDLFCGVPARLGEKGIEEIVELHLTDQEKAALASSAEAVRQDMKAVDAFLHAAA